MKTTKTTPPISPVMTPQETARTLGLSTRQLRALRDIDAGPKFYRLDAHLVRYDTADVIHRSTHSGSGMDDN